MKKTDRRVQKTKAGIRTAFLHLIQTKEYQSITITELASLANIDRKTFYLHYGSISDVLKEIENETAEEVRILLENTQPFDIKVFFRGLTQIMSENISFYRHVSTEASYAFFLSQCKNILKHSIEESFYRRSGLTKEAFNIYAEYIASGTIGIYTDWLGGSSQMDLDELTRIAVDAVSGGWDKITNG